MPARAGLESKSAAVCKRELGIVVSRWVKTALVEGLGRDVSFECFSLGLEWCGRRKDALPLIELFQVSSGLSKFRAGKRIQKWSKRLAVETARDSKHLSN